MPCEVWCNRKQRLFPTLRFESRVSPPPSCLSSKVSQSQGLFYRIPMGEPMHTYAFSCTWTRTLCEYSVSASPAHVAGDASVWCTQCRQMNTRGLPSRIDMGRLTHALRGSAATWRAHFPELSASTNPQFPTVTHLPVGTGGPGEGQRRGRHVRSLSEAPALGPGRHVIGIYLCAEEPDIVRDL